MDRDGAQNAKAEVFEQAFGFRAVPTALDADAVPVFAPVPDTQAHRDIVRARRNRKADPRDLIALGTLPPAGHNRDPSDLSLGIFIQHNRLRQHPIVEAAQRIARGEARVIFTGPARRRGAVNPGRCRPVRIGSSVAHHRVTAGTLGCFCRSRTGGGIGLLSNNHVLADTNKGRPGDIIVQPGRVDGGGRGIAESHIATLYRSVDIDFSPGGRNLVDCAFAYLLDDVPYEPDTVADPLDPATAWRIAEAEDLLVERDVVQKVGRTTGLTRGTVTAVDVDNLVVQMVLGATARHARFDRQIAIEGDGRTFSKGGDSGAVIFTTDGRPVALLFAGTETRSRGSSGITYANPIATVLEALDVEIYTGP